MTPDIDYEFAVAALKGYIQDDGGLFCLGHYLAWTPGEDKICLDCYFTADELAAIVYWIQHGHKTYLAKSVA